MMVPRMSSVTITVLSELNNSCISPQEEAQCRKLSQGLQETIAAGAMRISHEGTDSNLADLLSKTLPGLRHHLLPLTLSTEL